MDQPSESPNGPSASLSPTGEAVAKACREVLAALIEADGGRMFLVAATNEDVHIHLAGTCSGCPGAELTTSQIVAPALERVVPKAKVRVTTGWILPAGALRMEPAAPSPT